MDTGVDAPRVVNLVFFKPVKSSTKFWQMIGRGTRLCLDLFGPGWHKTEFAIFDYCKNFEFFGVNPDGIEGNVVKSLTQQVFEAKLELALLLREKAYSTEEQRGLAEAYLTELQQLVAGLDVNRFVVKANMRAVVEYTDKARWLNLSQGDRLDVNTHLSALILPNKDDDELARRFDVLILSYQLALLSSAYRTDQYINKISSTAKALLKKQNIQVIALQIPLLNDLQTEPFWRVITINSLDKVRVALRDLIKYLDKDKQVNVITTFEDDLNVDGIRDHDLLPGYGNLQSYKDRVESYIRNNNDHLVIHKLKTNKPITQTEINTLEAILFDGKTLGTQQDYFDNYGDKPLGEFIRGIVGLDVSAAQAAFADFIQAGNLRADQMTFINSIISYLTRNGMIDKGMLYDPPFTHIHDQGIAGVFDDIGENKVLQLIDGINQNALVFKEVA